MQTNLKYSIVVPVFNSSGSLHELCERIDKALSGVRYELILVDDSSTDNSWKNIQGLKQKNQEKIIAIRLGRNFGQHLALFCGFTYCSGDFVITMDDDLQHPPEEIIKLIDKQKEEQSDLVYGIYKSKQHSFVRNSGSFFVKKTGTIVSGYSGMGSSFRLIKKSIVEKIVSNNTQSSFYLDEVFHWYTVSFSYVEVEHHPRKLGRSGYNFFKLLNLYLKIVVNYSASPLKLMTWFGLIFSVLSFLLGVRFIYRKLVHQVPLGYTSIIVTILFSASIIMFCLGIIGQYLYKIYQAQQNKPSFSIREILK